MLIRAVACFTSVIAVLSGCTAGGGCENRVNAMVERGQEGNYPNALENDLRQLRDAALVFLQRGRETECADMANAMDDLIDDHMDMMEATRERRARSAYLARAQPVTAINGVIKGEQIIGAPVRNRNDEDLGAIENVALDPDNGQLRYVALATGGFIGLGAKLIAVPWKDLKLNRDRELYVIDLSIEALDRMKGFDANLWPTRAANQHPARAHSSKPSGAPPSSSR